MLRDRRLYIFMRRVLRKDAKGIRAKGRRFHAKAAREQRRKDPLRGFFICREGGKAELWQVRMAGW
jgi:hypothetical protein